MKEAKLKRLGQKYNCDFVVELSEKNEVYELLHFLGRLDYDEFYELVEGVKLGEELNRKEHEMLEENEYKLLTIVEDIAETGGFTRAHLSTLSHLEVAEGINEDIRECVVDAVYNSLYYKVTYSEYRNKEAMFKPCESGCILLGDDGGLVFVPTITENSPLLALGDVETIENVLGISTTPICTYKGSTYKVHVNQIRRAK